MLLIEPPFCKKIAILISAFSRAPEIVWYFVEKPIFHLRDDEENR